MSENDKKGGGGLDDFDWDSALAEWDKKPFEPEVASEIAGRWRGPARPLRP